MPSRYITILIILFWIGSTFWMAYREILPRLATDEPPPIYISMADEVARQLVLWSVIRDGKEVGTATTEVSRVEGNWYRLRSEFRFNDFQFLLLTLKKLSSSSVVNSRGEQKEMDADIIFSGFGITDTKVDIKGKMVGHELIPEMFINGQEMKGLLEPVDMTNQPAVINTLHPQNRIIGLWEGRTWHFPSFNPLEAVTSKFKVSIPFPSLVAEVHADELRWKGENVPCWRIDVFEPGKEVMGRTWVRRVDGLVLQQSAKHQGISLTMIRESVPE